MHCMFIDYYRQKSNLNPLNKKRLLKADEFAKWKRKVKKVG